MKAAVLTEYRKIEWMDVPMPQIRDSEVLVEVSFAGICGSDQHVFAGEFHPRTNLPLIQGHEFAGTIVETGKDISGFSYGDRVVVDPIYWCGKCPACQIKHYPACSSLKLIGIDSDGGFAEYVTVKDFMLYKIDPGLSERDAALVEPLAIGFHASKRASISDGDTLAVYGAGRIGQCIVQAARTITDNTLFLIDILEKRLELARSVYPNVITINAIEEDPIEAIMEKTSGRGVDIALEAVGEAKEIEGRAHPIRECIRSIRGAGKVCVLSLGDVEVPLVMKELIWKEGILITSRVTHGEFSDVLHHLAQGNLHPEILVSTVMTLDKTQKAYEMLEKEPENYMKVILKPPENEV